VNIEKVDEIVLLSLEKSKRKGVERGRRSSRRSATLPKVIEGRGD